MGEVKSSFSHSPINQVTGIPITFTSMSRSVERIAELRWEFDDGSDPEYGKEVEHIFSEAGVYHVELNVKDVEEDEDRSSEAVRIHARFGVSVRQNGKVRVKVSVEEYSAGPVKTGRKSANQPFDPGPADYDELTTRIAKDMTDTPNGHNAVITSISNSLQGKIPPPE